MVHRNQNQAASSSRFATKRSFGNTDPGRNRTDTDGALSGQDEDLPDIPTGGMVLDDSMGERDYSLTNEEVLRRIGIK